MWLSQSAFDEWNIWRSDHSVAGDCGRMVKSIVLFCFSFYPLLLLGLHSYSAVRKQGQAIFGMNGALGSDRHGKMF